ncbi:hypothetical protein SCLARK_001594 [Spiroplasma clarkii]|uniref:Rhodanese domain-containing protein n=1 Tax=Spiroplasma clarkii TaxID=2139 RepID=A0A1Y0L265_9MOLU|nr:rhodanese-like domain-containing protein [Spiroplasma clarkii]ARU92086.1 hypothetical protein SCLARK_001594 [Spiroplasma clarkii]ATX71418.1 hypothetical protein SCLAR_v1c11180 [Spiroplasma clarkii]
MKSISAEEFNHIKDEVLILDVRSAIEYKTLPKIPGSINVEIDELLSNYQNILKDHTSSVIVTVCNAGNRSGQAAEFLNRHGYNAFVLRGGIYGYKHKFKL